VTHHPMRTLVITTAALFLAAGAAAPARALIVFDPSNYAQNVLTAARTLQQINNQISALQNQAQMLLNQGRNLASLPFSSLVQLQGEVQRTRQLLSQAQHLAYDVAQIDQAFQSQYGAVSATAPEQTLVARAQSRWETAVGAFQDALRVQAGVVGNLSGAQGEMSALVSSSQGAAGALQVAQAGNQLLAVQARQLADLTALLAAQGRAQALDGADRASARADAQVRFRQFIDNSAGYQPGAVVMFH
jgi:P-type conjugative transfer protein TrbJ